MRVICYVSSVHDDAPERFRCIARILLADGSMHPVIFAGADKQSVRAKAEAWWAEAIAARDLKDANARKRAEAMRAPKRAAQPEATSP